MLVQNYDGVNRKGEVYHVLDIRKVCYAVGLLSIDITADGQMVIERDHYLSHDLGFSLSICIDTINVNNVLVMVSVNEIARGITIIIVIHRNIVLLVTGNIRAQDSEVDTAII